MEDLGTRIIQFVSTSPGFKGTALIMVGLGALVFACYLRKRWKEKVSLGFLVFILFALFAVLYGIFILVASPQWWLPPR